VQSPALRMIVERELEIEAFKTQEYWSIEAATQTEGQNFKARLTYYGSAKLEQFSITNEEQAHGIRESLLKASGGKLDVVKVEEKERKRNPAPPFITSTLQQEAARKLGFTTRRTMSMAQQLYEGIDLGGESVGLISYMRTDSVNLANEALQDIRELIVARFGPGNLPEQPRVYKTKSKNAQEAHEAIRPTSAQRTPETVKPHLSADQFKLYNLIWKRTVACQMINATIGTIAVDLACGNGNLFRANGSTVIEPGFMAVYLEGRDDDTAGEDDESYLPPIKEGQQIKLEEIIAGQHFTQPPPRYTEASLVKTLEEYGIGRPSTYEIGRAHV